MLIMPEGFSKLRWGGNVDTTFEKKTDFLSPSTIAIFSTCHSQCQECIPESNFWSYIFCKITDFTQSVPPWVSPLKDFRKDVDRWQTMTQTDHQTHLLQVHFTQLPKAVMHIDIFGNMPTGDWKRREFSFFTWLTIKSN